MTITSTEICAVNNWSSLFRLEAFQCTILAIPTEVLSYLLDDASLVLPAEAVNDRSSVDPKWTDASSITAPQPSFPEFSRQLQDGIRELGGAVFIKLNWSAPTDAAWITADKTLKCTNLEDIYLLLKSSARIAKDLSYRFKTQSDNNFCVVLKRWHDIHPGSEFRCFVMQHKLIAISQRHCKSYYKHIAETKFDIIQDIKNIFQAKIKDSLPLASYIFDIVRSGDDQVTLVDFSPFDCKATQPVLFTWEELRDLSKNSEQANIPEFRYLGEEPGYQPSFLGVPQDVMDLRAANSPLSLMDYVAMQVTDQATAASSSDSD